MKTVEDLIAVKDNPNCTDEDLKQYVGTLTEEEWKHVVKQLPKNPFLGKLDKLREQYLKEHKKTV